MHKIFVPKNIIAHCKKQINTYNFGRRGEADGNRVQQYTGIIGECVIKSIFGLELIDGSHGFDNGVDLRYKNLTIDVKTMGRTTDIKDYYVNNFIGLQKNYATDVYIFNSLNFTTRILTVIGLISKKKLLEKASFFKKGEMRTRSDGSQFKTKADLYEIENKKLAAVNDEQDLFAKLEKLNKWLYE